MIDMQRAGLKLQIPEIIFDRAPFIIFWESTRACDLACRHCRAEAIRRRDPDELTTAEVKRLFEQIKGFGDPRPLLIITGGDPLKREDIFELIEYGKQIGLKMAITPSGTKDITREAVRRFHKGGLRGMALSLDGSSPGRHDHFRNVPGAFDWTMRAAHFALEEGLPLQINTTVTAETADDLPQIYELIKPLGINRWSLFFLVPTGRGRILEQVSPKRAEEILNWLYEVGEEAPFQVKTTEAHHFRRVMLQRMVAGGASPEELFGGQQVRGRMFGINDGNGAIFVSRVGEVYPSGFLPLPAGNVRRGDIVEIYRNAPLFKTLRDKGRLTGTCGKCEFKGICGGSRARAYAMTGDYLQNDPLCPYRPGGGE
ncbi:MAG: TIGR04053 family radical SAM/SPASM domain-containing protein [Candidatus Bipolaricaulia bacterium]